MQDPMNPGAGHDDITPHTGGGKPKKQVRFDLEGDLDDTPTLPQGLTLFLVEGTAKEWNDAPSPFTYVPENSPQQPLEGLQHHPTIQQEPGLNPTLVICWPIPIPTLMKARGQQIP